jgi:trimethylamine---corrinoid protein Co-methyltransferase
MKTVLQVLSANERLDAEMFHRARYAHRGIKTTEDYLLTDVISKVGPGGNYLCEPFTASAVRSDDWNISNYGSHESYDNWVARGSKDVLDETQEKVDEILETHVPMPLGDDMEKELVKICKLARDTS